MTESPWITRGFILAGAVNIFGILLFSKGLTDTYMSELDPQVFPTFGDRNADYFGVESGLKEGDKVLLQGGGGSS